MLFLYFPSQDGRLIMAISCPNETLICCEAYPWNKAILQALLWQPLDGNCMILRTRLLLRGQYGCFSQDYFKVRASFCDPTPFLFHDETDICHLLRYLLA